MDLQTIAEGLLASIMVIGTAVIQIFLLGLLFTTAFAVLLLARWGLWIIWNEARATYRRIRNG